MSLVSLKKILLLFPVIKLEVYHNELCLLAKTNLSNKILYLLKNHFKYQFKILTCISGIDKPKNFNRFNIVYDLLSIKFNFRVRIKFLINELLQINSAESVFPGSNWWESEIWDMFGVFFVDHSSLIKLLTDYGFEGYPLRKDFPLSGFYESRYSPLKNRVLYSNLELCQEYRTFEFQSPWIEL